MTNTTPPVVLVGVGEMGGVFAKALLSAGHTVVPVTRSMSISDVATQIPDPSLVLVTVGEADLTSVLADMPEAWRDRTGLIQNELLPRDWIAHDIANPTVAVVWFENERTDLVALVDDAGHAVRAPLLSGGFGGKACLSV